MKIAFYPCCASDIEEPRKILKDCADEIIFCDINPKLGRSYKNEGSPNARFCIGDVKKVVSELPVINVLFYRRDSEGEGGSGKFILGDEILTGILERFPDEGGLIITDGSNSRGSNFERMIRKNGLRKHGWYFVKLPEQPFLDPYKLTIISVTRNDKIAI